MPFSYPSELLEGGHCCYMKGREYRFPWRDNDRYYTIGRTRSAYLHQGFLIRLLCHLLFLRISRLINCCPPIWPPTTGSSITSLYDRSDGTSSDCVPLYRLDRTLSCPQADSGNLGRNKHVITSLPAFSGHYGWQVGRCAARISWGPSGLGR